jgi:hypothetical protein
VPIGFLWNGSDVVMSTATTAPKVKALVARPRVALTIDTGDTSATAKSLLIRGSASVDIVDGVVEEYLESAAKTLGDAELEGFEAQVRQLYSQMARIAVTPDWARFYDFGAGRLPGFLHRLVEDASH